MEPEHERAVEEYLRDATIPGDDVHTLNNQEVAILLDRYQHNKQQANPQFRPAPMVAKTKEYLGVVLAGAGKNEDAATVLREKLTSAGLEELEMCLLVNLQPDTVEEAQALIPSLKRKDLERATLEECLEELQQYATYQ